MSGIDARPSYDPSYRAIELYDLMIELQDLRLSGVMLDLEIRFDPRDLKPLFQAAAAALERPPEAPDPGVDVPVFADADGDPVVLPEHQVGRRLTGGPGLGVTDLPKQLQHDVHLGRLRLRRQRGAVADLAPIDHFADPVKPAEAVPGAAIAGG